MRQVQKKRNLLSLENGELIVNWAACVFCFVYC
jgi:hypothetical protein